MEGTCPECEFHFTTPEMEAGETIACRECQLTLQVQGSEDGRLVLEPVEASLSDWGE
jgi:alpha-aminoadipate/glutamate carrier protein LysW